MTLFQWVVAPLLTATAILCLVRVRRGSLRRFRGLVWTAVWLGGAYLVLRPGVSTSIGSFFGIGRGADFLFYLAVVSGLYALLALYARVRRLETALTDLARDEAIRGAVFAGDLPRTGGERRAGTACLPEHGA